MAIAPQYGVGVSIAQYNTQIPMSVQYGVTPANTFIPIKVTASGELVIGGVTITGPVTVSDVTVRGVDPNDGNSEHEVAVVNFGADGYPLRSAIFDHANQLKINADGSINVATTPAAPVALKNIANLQINPATEDTLAAIKLDADKFTFVATRLVVDGSQVTQPISAVTLPLPTGAATQTTLAGLRTDFNAVNFATEASLNLVRLRLDEIALDTDNLDAPLSTLATEITLDAIKSQTDQLTFSGSRLQVDASISGSTDDDDDDIARAQTLPLAIQLLYGYNGTSWARLVKSADGLLVDGSGVTQPVSAVSLPLPTGAATSANQTNGAQKTKVIGDSGLPVTSTTVGSKEALDVNVTNTGIVPVSTSTLTSVVGSLSSVILLPANSNRKMAMVTNESTDNAANMYLKFGSAASLTSYTALVPPGGYFEFPVPMWPGRVDAIWSTSAAATARITELT